MKLFNSLRFQFIGLFTLFIVASVGTSALVGTRKMTQITMETFANMGFQIVERASAIIDGDSFEALTKTLDENDPFYEDTRQQLLRMKNLSGCLYLYTIAKVGDEWMFIIDGSDEPGGEDFSALGDLDDIENYDDAFWEAYNNGETKGGGLVNQGEQWGWVISVYTPIKNSAGTVVGVVGCDFSGQILHEALEKEEQDQIIIGGVSIGIGIILLIFFMRKIFSPLGKINVILDEISHGEGDVTKRITNYHDDEIGALAMHVNTTLDKIKNLIVNIKKETNSSFKAGNDLADHMQTTAESVDKITAAIETVEQKVTRQASSVTETSATMEQVTTNIDKLRQNVETQTESVAQSSSAIEEMLANVQSVTNTLINNEKNVQELIAVSDEGRTSLQKVSQDIQEIARESEGLLEINAVMENIASQTNLLSMNAAIEAAHAGESGKGFAVVAGEIRKLAESSSQQSKTISEVLKRIKSAIDIITGSTNTVLEKFHAIEERVNTVSEQETSIRNAMEEQGAGSKQVLEAVARMNELTQKVKQGSEEMYQGSREVIQESKNLEQVTVEISSNVNEMANGAKQMNAAVGSVNEISKTNKEHLTTLFTEVSKFKVE